MNNTQLEDVTDRVIRIKMAAVDKLVEEMVEPLRVRENPEKLIGKPYERWTPIDLKLLGIVYGEKESNPLSNFILKKAIEKVAKLEAEVV